MTIKNKKRQSLGPIMCDVAGYTLSEKEQQRLQHPLVGGVILFSRNYQDKKQLQQLISSIKALRQPELLIAVDQEGGRVQRFKQGFTLLPAAKQFGDMWDENKHTAPMAAFKSAVIMATELLEVGVDFSFAPVFDIETQASEVIGDRSFHSKPDAVVELAGAYIDGMHSVGMVCIAKHFPGHGGVQGDSHHCLPTDCRDFDALDQHDLIPYKALCDELDGVMTAHVQFPQCDQDIPTYSSYWLNTILRKKMQFKGVIFSDDLTMQGAIDVDASMQSIEARARAALNAGCDMLLVCNQPTLADELIDKMDTQVDEKWSYRLNRLRANSR